MPTTPAPSRTKTIIESLLKEGKSKSPKSGKIIAKSPGKVKYGKK